ncbi:membrane protein, partial [Mycobacterium sp. 20091114027_K0903767]|nr:membrane protein [Mycobacterium sp. 20091114027_K0903767]
VKPKSDISPELQAHLRYPEDLFKVQRSLLTKYHVDDPVKFFTNADFWNVPLDPNPTASSYQPPFYIVAKDLVNNDGSASFQLTSALNWLQREFLAAYVSASSDPATYGKITVLTIPGEVKGPKQAFNAISTDTAVTQDLGVIGRDNLNRIRWGNLLTLPVADGGLLYVAPVYASPGTSDAASTYPRLIRVAMLYGDKVGYGPTVGAALTELFGPGAGATATNVAPTDGKPQAAGTPEVAPPAAQPPANADGQAPQVVAPPPAAIPPGEPVQLSPAKAGALKEVESALSAAQDAQRSGDFGKYGEALQRLNDAMNKFNSSK